MANIQTEPWTVPNQKALKQVDFICEDFGYQAEIDGVANTETKAQFAQRMMNESFKTWNINLFKRKNKELRAFTADSTTDQIDI